MKPQNFEERLIWYALIGTYGFYLLGLLPFVAPAIAWILTLYIGKRLWEQTPDTPPEKRITISSTVWVWMISMLVMLVTIYISHINLDLGIVRIIKSVLKWSREWSLWGLFILIANLNIRPKLIYRAVCIICLESLLLIPVFYLAFQLNLPDKLYTVSPLYLIGGNSEDFYTVFLYYLDSEGSNLPRLTFFAPWAPNLALIALFYFFLAQQEENKRWRVVGMIGAIAMLITTVSRSAIVTFPVVLVLSWIILNFTQPLTQIIAGLSSFILGIFATQLINFGEVFVDRFNSARAMSSEVRLKLVRLSLDRWWNEAPVWGHGFTEAIGPAYTYFLPIGTAGCGTWVNLLYTKGLVGFFALAIPLLWSFINLLGKAHKSATATVGLKIILVFFFFSFIEELDLLAFIYWPGILMLGLALKEPSSLLQEKNTKYLIKV